MVDRTHLRPFERAVLARRDEGLSTAEIAERFRAGTDHIERVISYTEIPRSGTTQADPTSLRPLERRVLYWREKGLSHAEIGEMFRRSAAHIRRIEGLAYLRKGRLLLEG